MASQTNQSKKLTFVTKLQSNSFPRRGRESSQQQCSSCPVLPSELDSASLVSYTSLKDLLPSTKESKNNPYSKGLTIKSACEIPITNLLVKKAAWIYLQLPPDPSSVPREHVLCVSWGDIKEACFGFIQRNIINKIASTFEKFVGRNSCQSKHHVTVKMVCKYC